MSPSSEGPDNALPFSLGSRVTSFTTRQQPGGESGDEVGEGSRRSVFRIGGSIIPRRQEARGDVAPGRNEIPDSNKNSSTDAVGSGQETVVESSVQYISRTVRFPDEPPTTVAQVAGPSGQ